MVDDGGGWALAVRYQSGDACPGNWVARGGGCARPSALAASDASAIAAAPYAYSEVRGVVRALGYGGSDAFRDGSGSIDGRYVDGLSITAGSPRRHLFTFAQGTSEVFGDSVNASCPCDGGIGPPSFVGSDYRCEEPQESAEPGNTGNRFFDLGDPLFDGLSIEDSACVGDPESQAGDFVRSVAASADPIELRLMHTEDSSNEDTAITFLEIWVR
jgi:dynein heavy chain